MKEITRRGVLKAYSEGRLTPTIGKLNGMYGKHESDESKKNKSIKMKKLFASGYKNGYSFEKGDKNPAKRIDVRKKLSEQKKGNKNPMKRPEMRKYMSLKYLGRKLSNEIRKKIREAHIKRIEIQKLNGLPLTPCIGNNETEILNYIEQMLSIKIIRQYKVRSLFLDGYCPERNLAFEIDEPHHFDENGHLYKEDIERQQEIQKELGCNFIRVKEDFINKVMRMNLNDF